MAHDGVSDPQLITVEEAAIILGRSAKTVWRYLASKRLASREVMGRTMLMRSQVEKLKHPDAPEALRCFVYFVGTDEIVKIGRTCTPSTRFLDLKAGSPVELRLFGLMLSLDKPDEAELHRRFASTRVRGEWFRWTDELREFIASVNLLEGAPVALDEWFTALKDGT